MVVARTSHRTPSLVFFLQQLRLMQTVRACRQTCLSRHMRNSVINSWARSAMPSVAHRSLLSGLAIERTSATPLFDIHTGVSFQKHEGSRQASTLTPANSCPWKLQRILQCSKWRRRSSKHLFCANCGTPLFGRRPGQAPIGDAALFVRRGLGLTQ